MLDNLREAIARAQRLGDTSTVDMLQNQLAQKLKRSAASKSKIAVFMRTLTVQRRREERHKAQEEREKAAERKHQKKVAELKNVLAEKQLRIESAKAKRASALVKAAQLSQISKRQAEIERKADEDSRTEAFRQKFASILEKHMDADNRLNEDRAKVVDKLKANNKLRKLVQWPDAFWPPTTKGLRSIVPAGRGKSSQVYASERFSWVLFNNKRPQEVRPTEKDPVFVLHRVIERTFPAACRLA